MYKKNNKKITSGISKTLTHSKFDFYESFNLGLLVSMLSLLSRVFVRQTFLKEGSTLVSGVFCQVTDTHSASFEWKFKEKSKFDWKFRHFQNYTVEYLNNQ